MKKLMIVIMMLFVLLGCTSKQKNIINVQTFGKQVVVTNNAVYHNGIYYYFDGTSLFSLDNEENKLVENNVEDNYFKHNEGVIYYNSLTPLFTLEDFDFTQIELNSTRLNPERIPAEYGEFAMEEMAVYGKNIIFSYTEKLDNIYILWLFNELGNLELDTNFNGPYYYYDNFMIYSTANSLYFYQIEEAKLLLLYEIDANSKELEVFVQCLKENDYFLSISTSSEKFYPAYKVTKKIKTSDHNFDQIYKINPWTKTQEELYKSKPGERIINYLDGYIFLLRKNEIYKINIETKEESLFYTLDKEITEIDIEIYNVYEKAFIYGANKKLLVTFSYTD